MVSHARLLIEHGADIEFLKNNPIDLKTWLQYPKMIEMLISSFPHISELKAEPPQEVLDKYEEV